MLRTVNETELVPPQEKKPIITAPGSVSTSIHSGVSVRLEFKNITYEVKRTTRNLSRFWKRNIERKRILENISGVVEPGDLVALMGASGAGKSTLLNVLSRRLLSNDGEVLVNGTPADKSSIMKTSTCFIQQEDIFYGFITVTEHLNQQAKFRIPLPKQERDIRVQDVMDRFSLNKSRNSLIGNVGQGASRGISGGEKKRLSVATELLINPSLIFADEPTSGLDAFMAASVVEALKHLANSGHTVITTIHQPSSDVFAMFNKLLLLSEGRVIYYGPRLAAIPYFLRLGHPCPPYTNPADYFIELVAIDWENPTAKLAELEIWQEHWQRTSTAFLNEWDTELKDKFTSSLGPGESLQSEGLYLTEPEPEREEKNFFFPLDDKGNPKRIPTSTIIGTIYKRSLISTARNPSVVRARLIQTIVTALLAGLVYFRLGETATYSKAGACFFIMVSLGFMMTFTAITAFMGDKSIILRERDGGLYSLSTYFWAKICSDIVFQFYLPVIYTSICWFLIGLNDNFWRFLIGVSYIFLMSLAISSVGYIVASFAQHLGVAVALGPVLLLPFLMVGGFVIRYASLPKFWIWLYYLSPFVYGFSALMRTTFLNVEFSPSIGPPLPGGVPSLPVNGNGVLETYSIATTHERWLIDALALVAWIVLGRTLAMCLFLWAHRRRTK